MASIEIVPRMPAWLLDDTEESVLGTEWHQEANGATAAMIREEAELQQLRRDRERSGGHATGEPA